MYDMHYDLLTILYFNMLQGNKYANKEKMIKDLKDIYAQSNIMGGIINLYFTPAKEMKEEIGITIEKDFNIKKMFSKSIEYLKYYKNNNIIPNYTKLIYGIEGCDYIKDEQNLVELYNMGLRAITPVWNHENKYGSGNRTSKGLTKDGENLLKKAISLGIIIDVSHANEATFYDIINLYKKYKTEASIIIASHSNVRKLCNHARNLSDEQIIALRDDGGYIGLVTYSKFVCEDADKTDYEQRQISFIKHLKYLINILKFDTSKIVVSTDNMNFHPDSIYHNLEVYPFNNIKNSLLRDISSNFNSEVANKIIQYNAENIIDKVLI